MPQSVASAFNSLTDSIYKYPVQWAALIRSSIFCGAAFGMHFTGDQIASLMLVVESALGVFTHQQVTSNVKVEQDKIADSNSNSTH